MGEILLQQHWEKAGVHKMNKISLRVDLTPMVDLGFLLISFFIFTTTISQPAVMKLVLPDDRHTEEPLTAAVSKTLNLLLGANNNVYVYSGSQLNDLKNLGSNTTAMRDAIIKKKSELRSNYGSDSGMIVLIKPTPYSVYSNVVNALDEMLICNIKTYVLMDADSDELKATR